MGKDKLKRFNEMRTFENVYQCFNYKEAEVINFEDKVVALKGNWHNLHFKNNNPIVLELACGKGEYAVALARKFPNKNFIGIDIKGARMHKGAKIALEEDLKNVAFLRTKIQLLDQFFEKGEVSEIWITFSDPFPKEKHEKHRLTAPNFLNLYRKVSGEKTLVHLKHDSEDFFDYTLEIVKQEGLNIIKKERNIYELGTTESILTEVQTHYEKNHLSKGKKINYLQFELFPKK